MSPILRAHICLGVALLFAAVAGWRFVRQWKPEPLYPSPAMTRQIMLSNYHPPLKGTVGDTEVYFFDSGEPGGTVLFCGGTHANEPAAYIAAVTILENLQITRGRAIVIPRTNKAGFMHHDSQEAFPAGYHVPTPSGPRYFRLGSRLTLPVRQWPDPTIYINPRGVFWDEQAAKDPKAVANPGPGRQTLAGVDSRNINRAYPGHPRGSLTEQMAYAIVMLIREEKVDVAIDFHEASPEYPTINVMVAHERAQETASWAELALSEDGVTISADASALTLRGLSHREWGDAAPVQSVLFETANVVMGRLKGRTSEDQITRGVDGAYWRVQMIQERLNRRLAARAKKLEARGLPPGERTQRIINVAVPQEGISLEKRTGRHVQAAMRFVEAFSELNPDREIALANLPTYDELLEHGVGRFLHGPGGEPPGRPESKDADDEEQE